MTKFKHGSLIGFLGISLLLALVRKQQTNAAVVDAITLLVKNFPGYQITTCSSINIIDESKAYDFAYNIGKKITNVNDIFIKLFGGKKCWESLDYNNKTANFTYNLFLYSSAGAIKNNKLEADELINAINQLRKDFETNGFDTTKWAQDPKSFIEEYNNKK